MKRFSHLLAALVGKGFLSMAVACQPLTDDTAALIIQDISDSSLKDAVLVKLRSRICTELVRTLSYGARVGTIDVSHQKPIPTAWHALTSRKQALGDCHQGFNPQGLNPQTSKTDDPITQEVSNTVPQGTFACLGGESALEMLTKAQDRRLLTVLLIQANELESETCPEVWQQLAAAGHMVVILSDHPVGQRWNQQIYAALKDQQFVDFCPTERAIACVTEAVDQLNTAKSL